ETEHAHPRGVDRVVGQHARERGIDVVFDRGTELPEAGFAKRFSEALGTAKVDPENRISEGGEKLGIPIELQAITDADRAAVRHYDERTFFWSLGYRQKSLDLQPVLAHHPDDAGRRE